MEGTQITLRTMGSSSSVSSYRLTGLEIASLTGKQFYDLPEVYTQKRMPVGTDNIIKEEELANWPYLDGVDIPRIQADVELLMGTTASKMLEPREVVNSHGNGPYWGGLFMAPYKDAVLSGVRMATLQLLTGSP